MSNHNHVSFTGNNARKLAVALGISVVALQPHTAHAAAPAPKVASANTMDSGNTFVPPDHNLLPPTGSVPNDKDLAHKPGHKPPKVHESPQQFHNEVEATRESEEARISHAIGTGNKHKWIQFAAEYAVIHGAKADRYIDYPFKEVVPVGPNRTPVTYVGGWDLKGGSDDPVVEMFRYDPKDPQHIVTLSTDYLGGEPLPALNKVYFPAINHANGNFDPFNAVKPSGEHYHTSDGHQLTVAEIITLQ